MAAHARNGATTKARRRARRERLGLARRRNPPASPEAQALGLVIRNARVARGLSLAAAATLAGIDKSSLSRWENGVTDPPLPQLHALARVLGVAVLIELRPAV